jgi:hypothetical protein
LELKGSQLYGQSREIIYNIHEFMNQESDRIGNEATIEDIHLIAIHKCEERTDVACSVS